MSSDIWFPIAGIFFSIMITIVFLVKSGVKTRETKTYKYLLIINFIGLILELLCTYASSIYYQNRFLSNFILKSYLIYNIVWVMLLTYYTFMISHIKLDHQKYKKIVNPFFAGIASISILVTYLLPIKLFLSDDFRIRYTNGASVTFTYVLCGIFIAYMYFCALKEIKNFKKKQYIPIFIFLTIGVLGMVLQMMQPGILILTFIETFVTVIMYFTIENPDIRMIEMLNFAKDQAEKANNAKSDFLSSMSHEIRTPLNAIVGFSNSLIDNNKLDDESKDDVKNIIMASDSLLELVNGILDISKIEAGKLEIIDTCYNFPKIFDELVLLTKARLGEKPLEFNYSFDESVPKYLYGDATRVKQVILNLLTNSVKYTKEGYVDFKVHSVKKENIVRLIISGEDSGIGIKKESIDKLFSKFERLGVEKETTTEGTGLGLAITKRLVEMMNGKIVVQSIYGKGSKFTVSLDQKIVTGEELEKIQKEEVTKEENVIIDASGKKVLAVDDNNLNLKVAQRLLDAYKCNVECVTSGFECIDKIVSGEKYDLILLDDMMPKMSGTETLDKLKKIDSFNIPVVALTANAISGMKEEYLKRGFNDYLSKPIEKDELSRVMKKYLS